MIGYNQYFSLLKTDKNMMNQYGILELYNQHQHGFQLGVSGDLRLFSLMNLRLTPTILFGDRKFCYTTMRNNQLQNSDFSIETVYITAPLELKIRSKRYRNFRPYLILGFQYAFDLASLKNKKIPEDEILVRVNSSDWLYSCGVGFDFYLNYMKFGIELKSSFGVNNLLIKENKPHSLAIDSYKSQIFSLNFTFE